MHKHTIDLISVTGKQLLHRTTDDIDSLQLWVAELVDNTLYPQTPANCHLEITIKVKRNGPTI